MAVDLSLPDEHGDDRRKPRHRLLLAKPIQIRTHGRYGALGRTRCTKWAAVSTIRRAMHDGQMPRRLHEKPHTTTRLSADANETLARPSLPLREDPNLLGYHGTWSDSGVPEA
jgi:hypothetical protein